MSTKYEIIELTNTNVTVDVSLLKKDQLFFNATEIAKQFNKDISNFVRTTGLEEYINLLIEDNTVPFKSRNELVKTKQGGKHQGTWLHQELALKFAVWCSVSFEYELHKWIKAKLKEEENRKLQRELAKGLHPQLTKAIQQAHDNPQSYHYSNEMDMINRIVTGHSSAKYKEIHGVENVRDNLCIADIELLNNCQSRNQIMIEDGIDYETRKEKLTQYVDKQRKILLDGEFYYANNKIK